FPLALPVAYERSLHIDLEEVANDARAVPAPQRDERRARGGRRIGVVDDHRLAGGQRLLDQRLLPRAARQQILADVDVRRGEVLAEVRRFARGWEADEDDERGERGPPVRSRPISGRTTTHARDESRDRRSGDCGPEVRAPSFNPQIALLLPHELHPPRLLPRPHAGDDARKIELAVP